MTLIDDRSGLTARRLEVLASIAKTLAESGHYGVGMRALAQAAGLNPGTLYHHFQSKDDALLSICLIAQERTWADLRSAMQAHQDFAPRIRALFDAHRGSLAELGDFLQVYINLREHVPTAMAAPLDSGWLKYRRLLARLFKEAMQAGEIEDGSDVKHLSRLVIALIRVLNQLHRAGRVSELAAFSDLAVETLLRGLVRKR
ncbi:MAG: TetR/AcrR family transcriptional regulator [Hyphomonadaceae bacterium]